MIMLQRNLLVSIRSFKRHKVSFLINFLGLVGGLTTALFVYLWVDHELKTDHFHVDGDRIFRLVSPNGGGETLLNTSPRFARELEATISGIELLVNSSWGSLKSGLEKEEEAFLATGEFASEGFFQLFTYPLIFGNEETVLKQPNAIVLSERTALKLFNSTDIVGEELEWRWYSFLEPVVVTGVYKDPPANSSVQFDYVLSFRVFEKYFKERIERSNRNGRTFIKLASGVKVEDVNEQIFRYTRENYPDFTGTPAFLIGYADYYLHGKYQNGENVGGRIVLVRLFAAIGVLILVIACVNFMNLSTARATLRAKETGVRKVMGVLRRSLVYQYLFESCTIAALAGITSTLLLLLLFPFFQRITGQTISLEPNLQLILSFSGIILLTGLLSGSYPSWYLSGFAPLKTLKGQFIVSSEGQWLRRGLVVFQFGIATVLIVSSLVLYHQMRFIRTKGLGYANDYIVNFETNGMNGASQQSFLEEVRRLPGVEKASGISHALFGAQKSSANINWSGKDPDQEVWFEWGYVDYDMLELLEIDLLRGRFFSRDYGSERTRVVINKATWDLMEVEDPVGMVLSVGEEEYEVIGVTDDFHFQSLYESIKPTFFLLNNGWSMKLAMRIKPNDIIPTIQLIEELYAGFNTGFPFSYTYHDQDQLQQYRTEQRVVRLSRYAAGLAIFISCLGLFGLTSFIVDRKTKEMGIRKVLGASPAALFGTVSKVFLLPVFIATLLGLLVSGFIVDQWLGHFAYRVELQWWFFGAAAVIMLTLAFFSSAGQMLKVLHVNPVKSLRDE